MAGVYANSLSPVHELFLKEYLSNGRNSLAAYDKAYPQNNHKQRQDRQQRARATLCYPKIRAAIKAADQKVAVRTEAILDRYASKREAILEELAKLAFTNTTDIVSWDANGVVVKDSKDLGHAAAAVTEVSEYQTKDGAKRVKIKTADKRAALETLGKALGMFKQEDKSQQQLNVQFVIERD